MVRQDVEALPHAEVGRCVLNREGALFTSAPSGLGEALASGRLVFHSGRIRGAMPELKALP